MHSLSGIGTRGIRRQPRKAHLREALELLRTDRIDHGNACLDDPDLVRGLAAWRISLTVCPLSNLRLQVVTDMARHPLKAMLAHRLHVTVNSDDPSYFDGYVTENLVALHDALGLSMEEIVHLVRNGLEAAFVTKEERQILLKQLDTYLARHAATSMPQKS